MEIVSPRIRADYERLRAEGLPPQEIAARLWFEYGCTKAEIVEMVDLLERERKAVGR